MPLIVPPFLPNWQGVGSVVPYTARDNASFLQLLYGLRDYINGGLLEAINAELVNGHSELTTEIDALIIHLNETGVLYQDALDSVIEKANTMTEQVNAANGYATNANNSAVAAAGSATAANNSATASANSATAANNSAIAANTSAGNAAASATAATTNGAAAGTAAGSAAGAAAAGPAVAAVLPAAVTSEVGTQLPAAIATQKNVANGIAGLDANAKVANTQLPARIQTTKNTREPAANLAALTAIADGIVGDKVRVLNPGTGIEPLWFELWGSPGSNAADWRPAEMVQADTRANLNAFIAAAITDVDITFRIASYAMVANTDLYRFSSTAGAYRPHGPKLINSSGINVGAGSLAAGPGWTTIATITVPPGKWLITAIGFWNVSTAAARDYASQIYDNTAGVIVESGPVQGLPTSGQHPLAISQVLDNATAADKVLIVRAQTSAVDANQYLNIRNFSAVAVS